ncbi:FG-GAP repeat-containing protein [Catalinimonas alkaloidigena]|uniref:FG-GAP repeat-containing protein n=1 Tax=Catalinimonas alkaloidigena TaxID=1075417 RepID=A0A1G9KGR8_9BACT|nr:FG-GAP repeat-containing protein [Catalinimonas alkaloidigena]
MLLIGLVACQPTTTAPPVGSTLFALLPADATGIDFRNDLHYDKAFNIYTYRNFYNGGGVALGDVNGDGFLDVYLTANMGPNKLYLNKGAAAPLQFEDVTDRAGVAGRRAWSTGVSMADVNGDGWLDMYVCNSGDVQGDNRQNELFINQGDGTFQEQAAAYGLADLGLSTHAAFFDYDRDGDLDMYLLNNSYQAIGSFNLRKNERPLRDTLGGDKLYRNDGRGGAAHPHFTDVSTEAGIYGSIIGFGLGVTVGDVNRDGWMDLYISNDFFERDYLYLNQQNGTFRESLEAQIRSTSAASMGADLADINNDAYPDIFVTDMLPAAEERLKTKTTFDDWNRYQYGVENGYGHQFTRNTLQLNNRNGTFSEIGRLTGMEATDWSWGALIADLDNDGLKDVFVANGIHQDLTDQDFLQFIANDEIRKSIVTKEGVDFKKLISYIPSNPIANYAFQNQDGLRFADQTAAWGLAQPGFSNGAAYGDLDNDGDLDLIVNNVNMPPFVYRNDADARARPHHFLKFQLRGDRQNTAAFGASITLKHQGKTFYLEQMPTRGFESSVDPRPHVGLGALQTVDTVLVQWPGGNTTLLTHVRADQTLTLAEKDAQPPVQWVAHEAPRPPLFQEAGDAPPLDFRHQENHFVDFDRDPLLYHMLSTQGPALCKADVNGDGLDDVFVGNAKDAAGAVFVQQRNGQFVRTTQPALEADRVAEDTEALFFDADGDGDPDLYVCSGGSEFPTSSTALIDRLYLNDGRGNFTKSSQLLPTSAFESTSTVKAGDYDGDGDLDLFVGVRLQPFRYGLPCNGYVLNNDGKGHFTDVTAQVAPELTGLGMLTDAAWEDLDGDHDLDLVVVGEWMPVTVFRNEGGQFSRKIAVPHSQGWWNCLQPADLDGDGDVDFVAGNYGLNARLRASPEKPISMVVNDFDRNGTVEQILCTYNGERSFPVVLRHNLTAQLPALKKKYLNYADYQSQTVAEVFSPEQLQGAQTLEATTLATSVLLNQGDGTFAVQALPTEAQFSPVYGVLIQDLDGDHHPDVLLGGNLYGTKPEIGRYDASYGCLLKGDGKGHFMTVPNHRSGLRLDGEVRNLLTIRANRETLLLAGRNHATLQVLRLQPETPPLERPAL